MTARSGTVAASTRDVAAIAVSVIVAAGVLLRLSAWWVNPSMFQDESALARNIINRSYGGLMKPLDLAQGAPLAYLAAVKTIVLTAGVSERSLRALALVAGMASVAIFALVARRMLGRIDALLATAVFALCPTLIFFSAIGKQYSTDALMTTILLYVALRVRESMSAGGLMALGAAGVLAIASSHPALFVLATIGVWLAMRAARASRPVVAGITAIGGAWCLSFAVLYVLSLRALSRNTFLLNYWAAGFVPHSPVAAVTWLWNNAWLCVLVLFGGRGEPAGFLIAWLFGVGVLSLAATRRERDLAWLLGGPLLFTLFASALRRYPFGGDGGRLMLFAVPLFVLGAGRGWAVLAAARPLLVHSTLALAIGLPLMKVSVRQARGTPEALRQGDELRTVLQQMREQVRDGDHVYLFDGARPQFYLYMHDFGYLVGRQVTIHEEPRRGDGGELRDFEANLAPFEGVGRIWIVRANAVFLPLTDGERVEATAKRYGREITAIQDREAGAFLFDFSRLGTDAGAVDPRR